MEPDSPEGKMDDILVTLLWLYTEVLPFHQSQVKNDKSKLNSLETNSNDCLSKTFLDLLCKKTLNKESTTK